MNILKKFALLMMICAFINLNDFQIAFAYPEYVAIISNYNKVKDRIAIQRANGPIPGGYSKSLLYPGDTITGNVGEVVIECAPYADFHAVDNTYYLISYNPPSGLSGLVNDLHELTKVFWKKIDNILRDNVEPPVPARTRGAESESATLGFDLNPRPGFNTTLINNQKVIFAGVSKADNRGKSIAPKSFVIKDSSGQEIYSGSFDNNGKAELDLSSQNFKAGEKYSWVVDGSTEYNFTVLDEETAKIIQKYFSEIDAKKISSEERNLEKAFWAQQISDTSDGKINLYWLSAQLLTEISSKSDDVMKEKYFLLQKYHSHLKDEFKRFLSGR